MILEDKTYLGGKLVGIGKIRKTGELEYRFLEKPISNRIVNNGLDMIFSPNLTTNYVYNSSGGGIEPSWRSLGYSSGGIYGPLSFLAIGTGSTPTQFNDTGLQSIINLGDETYTYNTNTSIVNGTGTNSPEFGHYSFRITHQTAQMTSNVTIRELGWFGAYNGDTNYSIGNGTPVMFARVVLDSPIELAQGEYLIVTYQLDEIDSNLTETVIDNFFDLKDPNGNTIKAVKKFCRYGNKSSGDWSWYIGGPYITTSASGTTGTNVWDGIYFPYYMMNYSAYGDTGIVDSYYSTSPTKTFPANYAEDSSNMINFRRNIGGDISYQILDYTCLGLADKYRDYKITLGAYCPAMTGQPEAYTDIYYLRIRGMNYRLGYDDNGTWVPQALRKYANQQMSFTFRTRYYTVDSESN